MLDTFSVFEDRKEELELYYSIMLDLEHNSPNIKTLNNSRFFKILKSNYILMLYNLVEACTVSGIYEIYESLKNDCCTYDDVIDEIKDIWAKYQVACIYGPTTGRSTYENKARQIADDIIQRRSIILNKSSLKINGNLDAKIIKDLCDKHRIRYVAKDRTASLKHVKDKRNSLAHGDVSFSECARDLTLSDLEKIKETVTEFMQGILDGMKNYYDNKGYRQQI